ncbi:MAG TPA: hypothetical protein VN240_07025 [Propylenella sp.]|nr:hypothetical protein [Propylenella sp.]
MTRDEYLSWAKQRAFEYVDRGDLVGALSSMCSDLQKYPGSDLRHHLGLLLGVELFMFSRDPEPAEVRRWIDGFN